MLFVAILNSNFSLFVRDRSEGGDLLGELHSLWCETNQRRQDYGLFCDIRKDVAACLINLEGDSCDLGR